jgi:hypothetical protein
VAHHLHQLVGFHPAIGERAAEIVSEGVEHHVGRHLRFGPDGLKCMLKTGERASGLMAAEHVEVADDAGDSRQHLQRVGAECSIARSGLGVRQADTTGLEIDIGPFEFQGLLRAKTAEQQKP